MFYGYSRKLSAVISMVLALVILGEKVNIKDLIDGALITLGTFVLIL